MTEQSRVLTAEERDALARELDALRDEVLADLGERDVAHIRRVIRTSRYAEVIGRALLHFGVGPLSFGLGALSLGVSKILDNMEIGHNILHGQYDWTRDEALDSHTFQWDMVCEPGQWRRAHNFEHHTFTNVLGKDKDVGYGMLRVTPAQGWEPLHAIQPLSAVGLAFIFQWGVAIHCVRVDDALASKTPLRTLAANARPFLRQAGFQLGKDYAFFPMLAGLNAPRVLLGNLLANTARNLWAFGIIFCGHFPDGVEVFRDDIEGEGRGGFYLRQINGSANITGGRLMHVLSGHLSHQIEHHLFPDIPASRYPELAPRVREICARYGQRYNEGSLFDQLVSVARTIVRNAVPSALQEI